ncbi:MAG: hypothetical protein LBU64_14835, partial [Planctomycetota bacterium]|nr:hypothetical protein [Planctomycetota bacterium]
AAALLLAAASASAREEAIIDPLLGIPCRRVRVPERYELFYNLVHPREGAFDLSFVIVDREAGAWLAKLPGRAYAYAVHRGTFAYDPLSSIPPNARKEPQSAARALQEFVDRLPPLEGLELARDWRDEKTYREMAQTYERLNRMTPGDPNFQAKMSGDTHSAIFRHVEDGGEMYFAVMAVTSYTQTSARLGVSNLTSELDSVYWTLNTVVSNWPAEAVEQGLYTAEGDSLDPELAAMLQALNTPDPAWQARMDQLQQRRNQDMVEQQKRQWRASQEMIQRQRDIFQSRRETIQGRADAQSRSFNNMTDIIRGVERTVNPATGDVLELDYMPKHAYVDADNRVFYAENSLVDPNRLDGSSGTYRRIR